MFTLNLEALIFRADLPIEARQISGQGFSFVA
jgi:hypothetical protein